MTQTGKGVLAMVVACTLWGLSPLFYHFLRHVPATEVFAHRALWSMVIFCAILVVRGRLTEVGAAFVSGRAFVRLLVATFMVSCNWLLFIIAVQTGHTTQTALGYYLFPLVAVVLGVFVLKEKLGAVQWGAVTLAAIAVAVLALGLGAMPWVSLILAVTFGLYGLVKKGLRMGAMASVTAETIVLAPFAFGWLVWLLWSGDARGHNDVATLALLIFSGVLTAAPLMLFSFAAQTVRLSTVGLLQFINPTLQFFCAVLVFQEPFTTLHSAAFGLIWLALAIYSWVSVTQEKARRKTAMAVSADGAAST